jgi:alpha-N-arabinofuranosidase
MMAVNLGTGTPKEAGELVEYCNVPGGTYWSDLRREHGVEKPHDFKLWCLGNEMDGDWQICTHTAEEYARLCKETAKIVKWVDPSIETVACGSCTNELDHKPFAEWDRIVLEECYDYIDYLSLHRYFNYDPKKQLAYKMIDTEADIPFFFRDLQNYLDTVIGACDFVKGKKHSDKTVNISFDEWGVVTDTGAIPGGMSQEYGYASFKQMDGMIYGGILCTFLNNADRVKIACQSLLVNEGGMITTDPNGRAIRQTTYFPFQDAARYAKGKALRACASLPVIETEHHGLQESMTVACTYDEVSGEVTVFAANSDLKEDTSLTLELRSFGELEALGRRELYDDDPYAKNTFEDENRVVPQEYPLENPVDGKVSVILKKHSWNVLRFRVKK